MPAPLNRRTFLASAGAAAATASGWSAAQAAVDAPAVGRPRGSALPFPLKDVRLLDSPFRANQARNSAYLRDVAEDRLLHTFRLNVGLPSDAEPCGGWESPDTEVRGHSTGHLLSGLALTWANTREEALRAKGARIVSVLATCQERADDAGFGAGYLAAFPESFFDRLEAGQEVWVPYYTLHKIIAGLLDQYRHCGNRQALTVARRLGGWIDRRTGRLSATQMQQVLEVEFGGLNESLADLGALTGEAHWLQVAERFTHHKVIDPLVHGRDELTGLHANTQIPKLVGSQRLFEEGRGEQHHAAAEHFWQIVTEDRSYVIGGNSNAEHFARPREIATQLGPTTCENCNSYNMLKLTRLLHHHDPDRTELLDFYERTLFNQMLGEQDPESEHGANIYYTGLNGGAWKSQPDGWGDLDVYSTDYTNFSCDHGTGMESQAKFADTLYSRSSDGGTLYVNLFVPSEVTWSARGITWRQTTGFPDEGRTTLTVVSGGSRHRLKLRIPGWAKGATVRVGTGKANEAPEAGWYTVEREWRKGDTVVLDLPMRLTTEPTPDDPQTRAVLYGPVVLAGQYGPRSSGSRPLPRLDVSSLRREGGRELRFRATTGGEDVELLPVARTHHVRYCVYWTTGEAPQAPPALAARYPLDDGHGVTARDTSGAAAGARLAGGATWLRGDGHGVRLDGADGYLELPPDLLAGARAWSMALRVRLSSPPERWARLFDISRGTTAGAFLTPRDGDDRMALSVYAGNNALRYGLTAPTPTPGVWVHLAVTYEHGTAILYTDGHETERTSGITLEPIDFGNSIRDHWIGRSAYPSDPYLHADIADVSVHGVALTPREVAALA